MPGETWWLLKMLASSSCSDHVPSLVAHKRWIKITSIIALGTMVLILRATVLESDPADIVDKPRSKKIRKHILKKRPPITEVWEPVKEPLIRPKGEKNGETDNLKGSNVTESTVVTPKIEETNTSRNEPEESTDGSDEGEKPLATESPALSTDATSSDKGSKEKSKSGDHAEDRKETKPAKTENSASDVTAAPKTSGKRPPKRKPNTSDKETNEDVSTNPVRTPTAFNGTFVEQWCELQGAEWHPSGEQSWQQRAPYFLLPGAKKSGTTSLANYIMEHPHVAPARTKELQFFLNKNFRGKFVTGSGKTAVKSARQAMYARDYHHKVLENNSSLISFDGTPGYLFFSSMLPQRILCVAPWVKLVIVLRNPVDRAYSNWADAVRRTNLKMSFEEWIDQDFAFMKEAGLVHDWREVDFNAFSGSQQENESWNDYLRLTKEGPIGRGMYEMQLRHWFKALRDIGRDPKKEVLILRTEDMRKDLNSEYAKVLKFLDLPEHKLKDSEGTMESNYTDTMNTTTRELLEGFYAPYNKRLYKLLGGDWKGYWDHKDKT